MMYDVAIFDDDPQMLQLMANMMKSAGIAAVTESDINKLGALIAEHPEIKTLVIDIWHHNQAVFELLETSSDLLSKKKLVVISGGGPMSIEVSAAMAQFSRPDVFLSKPFSKQQFVDAVTS